MKHKITQRSEMTEKKRGERESNASHRFSAGKSRDRGTLRRGKNPFFFLLQQYRIRMEVNSSSAQEKAYDYTFKIVLIGDSGVGKSSIILNYTSDNQGGLPSPTIGVDFKTKILTLDDMKIKLTIWDTAGQERFRTLTSSFYRGAHGIIMVYDVTRKDTFTSLTNKWIEELKLYSAYHDTIKVLVGNKLDLESSRMVTREEGMAFANQHDFLFYESSAKTGENVTELFEGLLKALGEMNKSAILTKLFDDLQRAGPITVHTSGSGCCG